VSRVTPIADWNVPTHNAVNQRRSETVKVETLLPLGKVDPGLRTVETSLDISRVGADARLVEEMGYDGLVAEETKDDPYVIMALAAQATTRLRLVTGVAMAFPRSPTITAMTAWSLQKLSKGRFTLGLGSQVKGHIQRRFGMKWSPPGPWMREYVLAVRAIWAAWQTGAPLEVKGEHYNINLMVPLFAPGANRAPCDSHSPCGRQSVYVPNRRRGGRGDQAASGLHAEIYRGGDATVSTQGSRQGLA
jgi:Luciferase-like monooxygenase